VQWNRLGLPAGWLLLESLITRLDRPALVEVRRARRKYGRDGEWISCGEWV